MQSAEIHTPSTSALVALLSAAILLALIMVLAGDAGIQPYLRLAVMGVVALVVAVAVFVQPRWGVYFMAFYVYSGLSFYPGGGLLAMAVMALILAAVVVGMVGGDRWRLADPVFLISAGIFSLIALQSIMWVHSLQLAVDSYSKYLKAMAIVVFVVQLVRTPSQLRWLARMVFVGAVATVFFGVVNSVLGLSSGGEVESSLTPVRFSGAHANPNLAAALMTSAIPMGVFVVRDSKSNLMRLLAALGVLTIVVAVFATYSRQAVFALGFVAIAVLVREVRSGKTYIGILAALVMGVMLTPRYYWVRFLTVMELLENYQLDYSIYQRVQAAQRGWEMFKEHPLMGVGLTNFAARSGDTMYLRIPTHNIYLEIACGLGIFGLIAYLTMLYSGIRQHVAGMKERWREQDRWLRHLSYYIMVSLVSCMISGMFANIQFRHFVWILVAAGLVLANLRRELRAD
jgi:O-antigen ligase